MPRSARHPYLDHDGVLAFAHRGGAVDFPENTMLAFEGAAQMGYRYIETDVHLTKDGVLLSFHDEILDRVTDGKGRINELTYDEVKQAKIGGEHAIPLFEELLTTLPDIRLNVDTKADETVAPLIKMLDKHKAWDRVGIGSFSQKRLNFIRAEKGDTVCLSMAAPKIAQVRFRSWGVPFLPVPDAQCAQVPINVGAIPVVRENFVKTAHRHDMQVHVWTIDDEADMNWLLDIGVDGIMTDKPALLKQVLQQRGLWS